MLGQCLQGNIQVVYFQRRQLRGELLEVQHLDNQARRSGLLLCLNGRERPSQFGGRSLPAEGAQLVEELMPGADNLLLGQGEVLVHQGRDVLAGEGGPPCLV